MIDPKPVVQDLTYAFGESDESIALGAVLEWRAIVRSVDKFQILLVGVVVLDVTLSWCAGDESLSVTTVSEPGDDRLARVEAVEWYECLDREGESVAYLCKTVVPDLPEGGAPIGTDATVQDVSPDGNGEFTLTLVGTQEALSEEIGGCGPTHPPVSLRRLTEYDGPRESAERLTSRQREVLETAYELGYYQVPREATAAGVAEQLDLDRSTVTEHPQRAERRLVSAVVA